MTPFYSIFWSRCKVCQAFERVWRNVLWQIQIIKWGGPRLIQEARSVYLLGTVLTEVWHMAHFWVSYGRCTMPGSPMGRSEGLSRRWTG